MHPPQSRQAVSERTPSQQLTRAQGGALHERTAKKQSTAAQPRAPCGTTTPIHLIPLLARSFATGGVDLSKRARSCVEGRSPCRGRSACRGQVAVSRAGRRVEATGNHNFQKNRCGLRKSYIGPIKMGAAKKSGRWFSCQSIKCRAAAASAHTRRGAGGARRSDANGARVSSRIENGKSSPSGPVPIGVDHVEDEAGYQESASARCVSKD